MNRSVLNKLLLARRLLELARENLSSANDLSLAIGVNLLQDSVEACLLAVSEHVNAEILAKTAFDQYFDLINTKIEPKKLPFRSQLFALNKLRVNSKHYGLAPAKSETEGMLLTVREFLDYVTTSVLGITFATVSLIDLLQDGEAKSLLKEAEAALVNGEFETCLECCRKAIFVRIEFSYDIAPFDREQPVGFFGPFLSGRYAPYYARNKEYISQNVKDPTDYIVLDYNALEMDLMKSGMDSVSFWNVWRLTPEVYRAEQAKEWIVKRDFAKLEPDGIKERAEYVLDTTINLFVSADQRNAATRSLGYDRYFVVLRRDQIPVYRKADANSEVVTTTPPGLMQLDVEFSVPALHGNGEFWHVVHCDKELQILGYIQGDYVCDGAP
jgi:hypothetical protein